jgi:Intracellular proteinase inhibitor
VQPPGTDPSSALELTFEPSPPRLRAGEQVQWTFGVRNAGGTPVTLTFTSSQRGDVILSRQAVERYRWSRERMFLAVLGEYELAPGEEWAFTLEDVLDVEPGTYEVLASVTGRPAPPPVRGSIVVENGS